MIYIDIKKIFLNSHHPVPGKSGGTESPVAEGQVNQEIRSINSNIDIAMNFLFYQFYIAICYLFHLCLKIKP